MKALVKAKPEQGLWLEEVPEPKVGHNDLLVKVRKTAICGTDVHIYNWDEWSQETIPVPMTVGHEFCGVVAEVGSEVSGFQIGDRVSGEGHITCGQCRNCRAGRRHLCGHTQGVGVNRPGAFAEYLVIPAMNAYHLPDNISDEVAAILDPLGNATHTTLSFDLVGEDVLITGAGPIGIMATAIARHVGARHVVITDVNDYRLEIARRMGATRAVNATRETLSQVHGGHIAMLGIPPGDSTIDWHQVIFKGLTLKGIYGREIFETWYKMTSMLQSGLEISPILTHHFPLERFEEGFQVMRSGQSGKVVLDWGG